MDDFAEYQSPKRSVLENHLELIRAMRRRNWPFQAIRGHLISEHGVEISRQRIQSFCRRHGIPKGAAPEASAKPQAIQPPPASAPSQPQAGTPGKYPAPEEMRARSKQIAREVAEADAAKAAKKAKWNFAATEAEIFKATTPGCAEYEQARQKLARMAASANP